MMWFDPSDQRCLFGDQRNETLIVTDRTHREDGTRAVHVHPDALLDFRALPFADNSFPLLALTPHKPLFGHKSGKRAGTHWMTFLKPADSPQEASDA